jgi:spore coat protein CotH
MKQIHLSAFVLGITALLHVANAADGRIRLRTEGASALIQVQGDEEDDWRIETSSDLVTWTHQNSFGTLLSGGTNAPLLSVGNPADSRRFYRALKTAGLYDTTLFRTINLTFTQSNWGTLLATGRATGSNVLCTLSMDNGATNYGVGARYKGNTSYTMAGTKKSINIELDYTNATADLMSYETINLNNASGDETIMREPLYFNVMGKYTPCPQGSMARVNINGALWGVYSLVQQENGQLINEWFPSNNGDRWRAPNAPGGGGGGGGFTSSNSAFAYFNTTNISSYQSRYEVKTTNSPTAVAWQRLVNAIYVLNTTPTNQLRDRVEDVLAVDNWLWFLAIENIFVDDDSYWNKGADYGFYYEPESGRIHPVEHDGNEAFTSTMGITYTLSPVLGATGNNRPLLYRLLPINELRQRYLAHMRTVLQEYFNPAVMTPMIDAYHAMSISAILADPNKGFTMTAYTNELVALKTYVTNRYKYLSTHAELTPFQPDITAVNGPTNTVTATSVPDVTASVIANGTSGVGSVWLYHRGKSYGRFTVVQMFDDGAHGDDYPNDNLFGAATTNYPAGTKVRYYVEARGTNAARAARFSPARAETETYSYRVSIATASNTPVVINEVMASNTNTLADPQGEFDDWIELHNITDQEVDLTGRYLSDEPNNPRKWQFPAGTRIAADGYLMVWADEDSTVTDGLHASFRLSADDEELYLTDTDANLNAILDSITFSAQQPDRSYGRTAADADVWAILNPTPGQSNP